MKLEIHYNCKIKTKTQNIILQKSKQHTKRVLSFEENQIFIKFSFVQIYLHTAVSFL